MFALYVFSHHPVFLYCGFLCFDVSNKKPVLRLWEAQCVFQPNTCFQFPNMKAFLSKEAEKQSFLLWHKECDPLPLCHPSFFHLSLLRSFIHFSQLCVMWLVWVVVLLLHLVFALLWSTTHKHPCLLVRLLAASSCVYTLHFIFIFFYFSHFGFFSSTSPVFALT